VVVVVEEEEEEVVVVVVEVVVEVVLAAASSPRRPSARPWPPRFSFSGSFEITTFSPTPRGGHLSRCTIR